MVAEDPAPDHPTHATGQPRMSSSHRLLHVQAGVPYQVHRAGVRRLYGRVRQSPPGGAHEPTIPLRSRRPLARNAHARRHQNVGPFPRTARVRSHVRPALVGPGGELRYREHHRTLQSQHGARLLLLLQLRRVLRLPTAEQPAVDHPRARSPGRRLPYVPQVSDHRLPVADHHLLGAQLPGRLQQQGRDTKVREQRDEHPSVQLFASSVLAAQLHGRVHLVPPVCGRETNRDVGERAERMQRGRAQRYRRRTRHGRYERPTRHHQE